MLSLPERNIDNSDAWKIDNLGNRKQYLKINDQVCRKVNRRCQNIDALEILRDDHQHDPVVVLGININSVSHRVYLVLWRPIGQEPQ